MLWFSKKEEKKEINSKEYENVLKRIAELEHRLESCERKDKSIDIEMEDLRNKVLRKIQFKQDKEEEQAKQANLPKSFNSLNPFA